MPISRFLFLSSKHQLRQSLNLLQRFGSSKRIQSRSHTKSTEHRRVKPEARPLPVKRVETQAPRMWGTLVIPVAVFAGLAALVYSNDQRRAIPKGEGNKCDCANVKGPIIGGPFTLVDTNNRVVTEQNFIGKWVLLYFGYTSSPDVGPEQVQVMAKAIDTLESKENTKVLPVFVTIDPQRDTPSHLRAYLKEFDSRIAGLTGPVGAVRQMAQEYRVYFRKVEEEGDDYLVESSHNMYLINPNMEVARCFGVEYNAEELAEEILKELRRD
ncbi:hypothetical protein P3X46_012815 [Hevea brasiliensis]|uniref:Thioredoxin domain-containing protein n=1 Tax=Hevea brasiliensis TaxID=3981 RepID=A0ABQ9MBJ0_HEVBR|nr:protein SCO1 homolog 2, mitochondrial isoform X1 [Hevea brasiliensis]KAJ9177614.1 hypothetical protein P3X46_012815 [Hevea brasiliensis]